MQERSENRLALVVALVAASAAAPTLAAPAAEVDATAIGGSAAEAITGELLRSHVAELASDTYQGRGPGSDGDALARAYLVRQLEALGLQPGGDGGQWEQTVPMVGVASTAPSNWSFRTPKGELALEWWDQVIAFSGLQQPTAALADAELVFAGYGIQAPEFDWDDFKGFDVRGKVLVIMNNDPEGDPALFAGARRLYYGRWDYKYAKAAELGAAGAIIIHTTPSAGYPFQVVQTSWTGEQFEVPAGGEPRVQVKAWMTEEAARELVGRAGHDLDALRESAQSREFQPVPLGVRTSYRLTNTIRETASANVLGRLPGRDPALADEVVVYTAHHDHLGIGAPDAEGDVIYNGAQDNAAGVSQLLAIAKAFTALPQPPRRSILFLFVAAEEQGLLGSETFTRDPTVEPGKMAANINYDGGNIWGPTRDITYIGYGKSSLDAVVERYAATQQRAVKPDQFPDRGFFYRSDQFNFARIGVPAIYFDNGTDFVGRPAGWGKEQIERWEELQYHQPSDELTADWNFEGMGADARLGFWCGLHVAESDELPSWKPGDEFEAARVEALAAVRE